MGNLVDYSPVQLDTIRRTVAKDTNRDEFDQFMAAARGYGLDPFRRQISAIVFNKDKPEKRQMSIIVQRDGLRTIAQRCGDYRPAGKPAVFDADDTAKGPGNPLGLVSCTVTLHKQDNKGDWYDVSGQAYWDEFAPMKEIWELSHESGKREPTGKFTVDGNWRKMPRLMLQKCAEAQALRAGWPDQFLGLYVEEEMDAAQMRDITPSEAVEHHRAEVRKAALGGPSIMFVLEDTGIMESVKIGDVADRVLEVISSIDDAIELDAFLIRNREPLRQFWAYSDTDALALKKEIEARQRKLAKDKEAA